MPARRRRRRAHLLPLAVLAVLAFAGGVVVGRGQGANERAVASEYVRDWAKSDFVAMYGLLDAASRQAMGKAAFTRAYRRVADTATLTAVFPGRVGQLRGHQVQVAMRMRTRLFGILSGCPRSACLDLVDRDLCALLAHLAVPRIARGRAPHPRRGHARPG